MSAPVTSPSSAEILAANAEPDEDNSFDDILEGFKAIQDKRRGYNTAEQYFEGTRPEFFANVKFRQALKRTSTTFRLNYAKTAVESATERLEINGIIGGDLKTTAMLELFWEENEMDLESLEVHRRACEFGDAYLLIWPNDDADQEFADDEEVAEEDPEVTSLGIDAYYNDPRTMVIIYDPENPRRKKFAYKLWITNASAAADKQKMRCNLYYRDRIEKYQSKPGTAGDQAGDWVRYQDKDDDAWPLDNPYNRIPVFHFRTDRPYGTPLHKDAYGPQDVITKTVITHMNTMDYHGFPQRWALANPDLGEGDDDSEDFGIGDDDEDDVVSDSSAQDGTRSGLQAQPGHVWFLKNIKQVGQFDAAQPNVFLQPLQSYVRSMAQVTRTPVHKFDFQGNPPSGESLRVAEQPFIKKINNLQLLLGATWDDALEFVRIIIKTDDIKVDPKLLANVTQAASGDSGIEGDDIEQPIANRITVTWANPAAKDDQLSWDLALLKRDAGVPTRQVLLEAGYTKKQLDAWGVPASKWIEPPAPASPTSLPTVRTSPIQQVGKIP